MKMIKKVDNRVANRDSVRKTRNIGNIDFTVATKEQAISRIVSDIHDCRGGIYAFCNMHTFNLASHNIELRRALKEATVFNDGIGIDIASQLIHGCSFPENLNGTDLVPEVLDNLKHPTEIFFIGSLPGVAEEAAEKLSSKYGNVRVSGHHHGFFSEKEMDSLVAKINLCNTKLLIVGMGNPRQEIWAHAINKETCAVILCVGAYLDFAAGRITRAPMTIRKLRLEWMYRLAKEPKRLAGRYMGGALPFLWRLISIKVKTYSRKI